MDKLAKVQRNYQIKQLKETRQKRTMGRRHTVKGSNLSEKPKLQEVINKHDTRVESEAHKIQS